jgi:predicted ATP-dependent endonuclease of OLD family
LSNKTYIDFNKNIQYLLDTVKYWTELSRSIVFIDPIRHYSRKTEKIENINYYFEGNEILNDLINIRSSEDALEKRRWLAFRSKINEWLKELLNEDIEFKLEGGQIQFILKRGDDFIVSNFNEVGTGVSQLFMMLSFLFINKEKQLNVFIDEPEANLHPEAVKVLVKIFENYFKNHSFFITTHASSLIDEVDSDWSIHRVIRSSNNSSQIVPCNSIVTKYKVLDDLGIRASQLLQSNMIIWVEGPSDRIYINKWIKDLAKTELPDTELLQGKHYSFLMYGGSNLNTHTLLSEDNEDNIDILCTSRYAVIVCDSDYKNQDDEKNYKLKSRVKKIYERLNKINESEQVNNNNIEDFVKFWITEGRETENYVSKELLLEVLSSTGFKRSQIKEKDSFQNLVIEKLLLKDKNFGKFDAFDEFFTQIYKIEGNKELNSTQQKNISTHYSSKKVEIAKSVVSEWTNNNYDSLDLKERIIEIINLIKIANGIQ